MNNFYFSILLRILLFYCSFYCFIVIVISKYCSSLFSRSNYQYVKIVSVEFTDVLKITQISTKEKCVIRITQKSENELKNKKELKNKIN